MIEITKKRRRWPWIVLAISLLLLSGPIAWQFRPLTATERLLLGPWREGNTVTTFTADRRYEARFYKMPGVIWFSEGSWRASGKQVVFYQDPIASLSWRTLRKRLEHLLAGRDVERSMVAFASLDQLELSIIFPGSVVEVEVWTREEANR